ncbi:ABC transporter ATP-binding protein [Mechercharimyces sp. CAU 1602]|uniref:ABC transporter ATP-binding protein n=1 Tax=Mechercharimyces sp. CAU 1602 TaxID=2973933 RepID=UPI002162C1FE|nr:ATP-binding cassette domain-containing protein [Mechercharimyces sp. CAU 1602]MCS1350678.1 ATP-binding cassette domain-containing protein [Mechercharimyces sp. CAU 1602]
MTKILEVNQVSKKIRRTTLISDMSFHIDKGDICGLLGPNGAGKTTLIRMLTGLITPTTGNIVIASNDVTTQRQHALYKLGAIVESPIFFPYLTGRQMLRNLALLHPNLSKKEQLTQTDAVLEIVNLQSRADDRISTYSLGMKQRLGIAQALLGKPEIIILDEPSNGLDPIGMRELRQLILTLQKELGLTFLISSHLLDELQQMCNRLIMIKAGKRIWSGTMEEIASTHNRLEDVFVEMMTQ